MNHPTYNIAVSENRLRYEFVSTCTKEPIRKIVEYSYLTDFSVWNLGFGDFDEKMNQVSDRVVSNNGDGRKVIATVANTLLDFFNYHPNETVIFTGSDNRRTSVYKRIILQ